MESKAGLTPAPRWALPNIPHTSRFRDPSVYSSGSEAQVQTGP